MAGRRTKQPATAAQQARWAEQRQAKLADLHQRIVDEVGKLTDGAQWRRWLSFAVKFHDYSFANTLAILAQRPDATWVAGYERWKALGRQVRKGETGIAILAPITGRVATGESAAPGAGGDPAAPGPARNGRPGPEQAGPDPAGQKPAEPEPAAEAEPAVRVLRGFKIVHVFDVGQTAGDGPDPPARPAAATVTPQLLSGQAPAGLWDALVQIAEQRGYTVERGPCGGANGVTDYTARRITVRDDVDDAQAAKTMIHEIGHVLLHTPQDFGWGTTFGCRGQREVEAESVAFLVAAHHGLDTSSYTFAYVTGWAQRAATTERAGPEDIVRAAGQRIISTAFAITEHTDAAMGIAAPAPSAALAARVAAGAKRTADLRATAETSAALQPDLPQPPGAAASAAFPPLHQTRPAASTTATTPTATATAATGRMPTRGR